MIRWQHLALCALGGAMLGWGLHRPRTVTTDHTHEVQAQQQARVDTAMSSAGKVVYVQGPERVITRTFACPDGRVSSERIEEKGPAREVATTQAAQVQHAEVRTQVVERDRVVLVPPPRWVASALVGVDGLRTTPNVYGGALSYRIAGPIAVGAWGTNRAAGVMIEVHW